MMSEFIHFRDMVDKGFEDYCYKYYHELSDVYALTKKHIGDSPAEIEAMLEGLSTHLARTKEIFAMTEMFLDVAIHKKMPDKGNITELERKAKADYLVAEERCIRNKVRGLVQSMEIRIMVLQSKLKSANKEYDRTHK